MAWVVDHQALCHLHMGSRSWGPLDCSDCSLQHFQSNGPPYRYAIKARHSMTRYIIEESAGQYYSTGKHQRLMAFVRFRNLIREGFGLASCFACIMLLVFTYCCSQSRYLFVVFALYDLLAACCCMAFLKFVGPVFVFLSCSRSTRGHQSLSPTDNTNNRRAQFT